MFGASRPREELGRRRLCSLRTPSAGFAVPIGAARDVHDAAAAGDHPGANALQQDRGRARSPNVATLRVPERPAPADPALQTSRSMSNCRPARRPASSVAESVPPIARDRLDLFLCATGCRPACAPAPAAALPIPRPPPVTSALRQRHGRSPGFRVLERGQVAGSFEHARNGAAHDLRHRVFGAPTHRPAPA